MARKTKNRYRIFRAGVLSASLLSFVPLYGAIHKDAGTDSAVASSASGIAAGTQPIASTAVTQASSQQTAATPAASQGSSVDGSTPAATSSSSTSAMAQARTRAS